MKLHLQKTKQATYHDEKLFMILKGFMGFFAFQEVDLFSYSELTRLAHGVFRINKVGVHCLHHVVEKIDDFIPFLQAIEARKTTQIFEADMVHENSAHYLKETKPVVIIPISFNQTVVSLMSATKLDKSMDLTNEHIELMDTYATYVSRILYEETDNKIPNPLTNREREVMGRISRGESVKEVALILGISEYTVQDYVKSTIRKLKVNNRTEAVATLLRKKIIY